MTTKWNRKLRLQVPILSRISEFSFGQGLKSVIVSYQTLSIYSRNILIFCCHAVFFLCLFIIFVAIRQDRSTTGHILGRAQAQQQNVTPERNLNPFSCGVLRCLTHAAMLLGTDEDIQVCTIL
jgi:hypothetical protein